MTLTFENDLNMFKVDQRDKYSGQRSCSSKVILILRTETRTHIPGLLLYLNSEPQKWSMTKMLWEAFWR